MVAKSSNGTFEISAKSCSCFWVEKFRFCQRFWCLASAVYSAKIQSPSTFELSLLGCILVPIAKCKSA